MLKKSAWLLHLIDDKAPPVARGSSEAARKSNIVILTPEKAGSNGV